MLLITICTRPKRLVGFL